MVLCIQRSVVAAVELLQGLILQLMREQASAIVEKAKQKLKNSETWSLGKPVVYSSLTLFIQIHGKKLPKSISIRA